MPLMSRSDIDEIKTQIQSTHAPDGREVDVKPLFHFVQNTLRQSIQHVDYMEDHPHQMELAIESDDNNIRDLNFISKLDALSDIIDRVSDKLASEDWSGTNNSHATTTISILNILASYSWEDKPVLSLAAFAFNYAKFWHNHNTHSSSSLTFAKSTSLLKQLPSIIMEQLLAAHTNIVASNPGFKALNNLIKTIVDLAEVMVNFKELPPSYISQDVPPFACAVSHIPFTVYWTIRSIVAATETLRFSVPTSVDTSELSTFIATIYSHMRLLLEFCLKHIEERKVEEYYQKLLALVGTLHTDNYNLLRTLICPKDDILPLLDGYTKRRVSIDVLRKKFVLLFITDMDVFYNELFFLKMIYEESKLHVARTNQSPQEIVWIPIVDQWNDGVQEKFDECQSMIPWYSIYHPSIIDKAVIRFIKNVWQFRKNPIIVVLDPQGTVVSPNALHMMFIWGALAFPFTTFREEALWRDETFSLEMIVDSVEPAMFSWIHDDKYIFLYGGDDIDSVRKFTNTVRRVAQVAEVPVEMVYVGKSSNREQVQRIIQIITGEKLSHCLTDPMLIWFFWSRLERMLFSKLQVGQTDDHDMVMQGIEKLLSYDKEHGWVLLARGSQIVALGHWSSALTTLLEFEVWKVDLEEKGFHGAYADYHNKMAQPCCRLDFTTATVNVPDNLQCPECHHHMEKLTTFNCCHNHEATQRFDLG